MVIFGWGRYPGDKFPAFARFTSSITPSSGPGTPVPALSFPPPRLASPTVSYVLHTTSTTEPTDEPWSVPVYWHASINAEHLPPDTCRREV